MAMRPLIALSAFIALGACTPGLPEADPPKANRVSMLTFSHSVGYDRAGERASPVEAGRFLTFLDRIGLDYGDAVALSFGDELGRRRAEILAAELRRRGLSPVVRQAKADGGSILVTVNRYVVTPPACGDWMRPSQPDYDNRTAANFGCATTANLGLMVAAPGDLVQGRAAPRADGDASVLAIQRYRTGKMRALPDSDMATTTSGTSGGAQ
jgi:pilus assembly protein CpaD